MMDVHEEYMHMSAFAKNMVDDPIIRGIVINFWDITDQKKNVQDLIDSETSYYQLFNNATDAIYIQDEEGNSSM